MVSYLLKTLVFVVFSLIIAYFYYFWNSAHIENFDWYLPYVIIIWIIYSVYKYIQLEFSDNKASFSLFKILWFFLLHLLVLCILFFSYNKLWLINWIKLFFSIIFYSILPLLIVLSSVSFWQKVISYFKYVEKENNIYKFILSFWIWFFSFVYVLDILGIIWFYNAYVFFIILFWFIAFSYKQFLNIFTSIYEYKFEFDIDEWSYLKLITTEFLFLISTLLLSINLISIVRPFPIWWDDLWVYMNYPHLMAEAWKIIALWWMYSWQTLTGIGYMFWSPTQAFFLNNIGGFMSFILIVLITSDLLNITEHNHKKSFINIPLLVWTLFIAMPMIVFQQAKDMKLDPGLFFVSITAVYLLYKYYIKLDNEKYLDKVKEFIGNKILHRWFHIDNLVIILVVWILVWFAFTIKFTTLLLISAIIGVMFFVRLGIFWFLWYLALYFAIFTKWNLWWMMNVVVNPDKIIWFENKFFIISGLIWLVLLIYSVWKNKWVIKKFFMEFFVFILWIIIALLPWIWKNIYEVYPNVTFAGILWWTWESFDIDYTKIYTQQELDKINSLLNQQSMSNEWTTTNEDLWRYFGYEKWANNYIKLPWNLTMQLNQWGEFTDIWFLFLALLPVVLLFLPYKKKYYPVFIVLFLILELFVFLRTDNKLIENTQLASFSQMSEEAKSAVFQRNEEVFRKWFFNDDIYDIKVWNYVSRTDIQSLVSAENSYESIEQRAIDAFYSELKTKVINPDLWKVLDLTKKELSDKDYALIQELRILNVNFTTFNQSITSINDLKDLIKKYSLNEYNDSLLDLWKNNRTIYQSITDFLSTYNLPSGYLIVFLVFFLPMIWLLYVIDTKSSETHKLYLFNLNLVFATFYTFLWNISAFWIVWYWIVMYFSFLLAIAIWLYYMSSYKDESNEKEFFVKLFWSSVFIIVVLIYIVNSILPHSFTNLKWAWYEWFKTWEITTISAPYLYHQEYLKILFYLNVDQNKKQEFLTEYIKPEIRQAINWIENMDIYTVKSILTELIQKQPVLAKSAQFSLNNIYKNTSNPVEKYKNKSWIYRIGTFLKYHISENNTRLFEDSLIFSFNDYIYNPDINKTIENFKKMWVEYILADLNAATIDKDARHNLTTRYEKLLDTFKSDKLEFIESDSTCLRLAIYDYNRSQKTEQDRLNYMTIAWVNYESYTSDWKQINRNTKLLECYKRVQYLIDNWKIDSENYWFLLNLANYMIENKASFQTEKQYFGFLQQQLPSWYKVLFRIK